MLLDKTDQMLECLLSLAERKAVSRIKHLLNTDNVRHIIRLSKKHVESHPVIAAVSVDDVMPVMLKDTDFPQFAEAYNKDNSKKSVLCNAYINTIKDKYSKELLEEMCKIDPRFKNVTMWELIMATKYMSNKKSKERK